MARVLLTGADGFTGAYLAPLLARAGPKVSGFVASADARSIDGLAERHVADLRKPAQLTAAVVTTQPEHVVHLAGISFVGDDPEPMYAVNLLGTRHLLDALASLRTPPRSVLLASSANVYGNAGGMLTESTPTVPANDYAVSKLAMEQVAHLYAERLPIIVCRPFNYTGVGQAESFLMPKIVAHLRRGETRIELGNLDVARDLSDVRDVAAIYARLLFEPAAIGTTLNVCSGHAYTLREMVAMASDIAGRSLEVVVNPAFVRANEVKLLLGSRDRLDAIVGAGQRRIALPETVRWMIESAR